MAVSFFVFIGNVTITLQLWQFYGADLRPSADAFTHFGSLLDFLAIIEFGETFQSPISYLLFN